MNSIATSAVNRSPRLVALQYRDFRLLWMGKVFSLTGTAMQQTVISWHIYSLTGSAVALGIFGLAQIIPTIVFSFTGGIFADMYDRRRLMMLTQSAMMFLAALLGLATAGGWVSVAFIYLIAALTSCVKAFDSPAHQSMVPGLVNREHLPSALSLNVLTRQLAAIIGPACGGFLIASMGIAGVYWINAMSFLGVIAALVLIHTPPQQDSRAKRMTIHTLVEGIQFVRNCRVVLATMVLDFLAAFFASAYALLPIFARDILNVGPEGLGILYSAEAVGALVASAAMSLAGKVKSQGVVLLGMVVVYGLATTLFGASQWFVLSLILLAIVGAADTVGAVLRDTINQVSTPDHLRGRMTSVSMIFYLGGPQLGNLEAGLLAAFIGTQGSVIAGGIATIILGLAAVAFAPQIRDYRD